MESEQGKSTKDIHAERARRVQIWQRLQPIAKRILEEFRQQAKSRGVLDDNWMGWFDGDFIFARVNIKRSTPRGPYYALLQLYKDGKIELDQVDNSLYGYPDFSDNAVSTFRPKLRRELQYRLDEYCASGD